MNEFYIGLQTDKNEQFINQQQYLHFVNSNSSDISLKSECSIQFKQDYFLRDATLSYDDPNRPRRRQFIVDYNETFSPLEPINLVISRNYATLGLEAGQNLVVPAFIAMVIENNILRSISEKCWRKIINGAIVIGAVCASPASGGTSLAVLTESVATINLGVALYDNQIEAEKEKLTPSEYTSNAEFYTRWEQLRSAALIADMGIGATNILYKALPKIGAKLNVRASNQNPH